MVKSNGLRLVSVNQQNIYEYPPTCFMNRDCAGYKKKYTWLKRNFRNGLKIKQLYRENTKECIGFIEYIPGENAWRAVSAEDYLFIHCVWVSPKINRNHGHASTLINECISDAKNEKKLGVAVVTSDGPFMADKELFLKNGFKSIVQCQAKVNSTKRVFDLMVKPIKNGPLPEFKDWQSQLAKLEGLNIIYAPQCPWIGRGIQGMVELAIKNGHNPSVVELKTSHQAQNAPSVYSVFNLVYNGKLLADHYISNHRFSNILAKEVKKQ